MNQFNGFPQKHRESGGLIDDKAIRSFGNYLAQAALKLEKDEKMLAEKIGVTARSITSWEEGDSFPKDEPLFLQRVAEAYGVTLNELKEKLQISKDAKMVSNNARKQKSGPSINPLDPNLRARSGSKGHFPAADNGNF